MREGSKIAADLSFGSEPTFVEAYLKLVAASIGVEYIDNFDQRRFGKAPRRPFKRVIAGPIERALTSFGLVATAAARRTLNRGVSFVAPHCSELQWLYTNLADNESRALLVHLVAYRALGHRRVKLPLNRPSHWNLVESIEKASEGLETIDAGFLGWKLRRIQLQTAGYPVELYCTPMGVVTGFIYEQYRCLTADGPIEAELGDVVIDAGGCWGDTALYFAAKVGPDGEVVSFEFLPTHLEIYRRNMSLNPELASRIRLCANALWSSSGQQLAIHEQGPGTSVSASVDRSHEQGVTTSSVDDLVEHRTLNRVDFIKMDIEGAELSALAGSEAVLRRFHPRLAITVYHRFSDLWQIPQYLDSLGAGYRFYLRHFTVHSEETVLFARSVDPPRVA